MSNPKEGGPFDFAGALTYMRDFAENNPPDSEAEDIEFRLVVDRDASSPSLRTYRVLVYLYRWQVGAIS